MGVEFFEVEFVQLAAWVEIDRRLIGLMTGTLLYDLMMRYDLSIVFI